MDAISRIKKIRSLVQELSEELKQLEQELAIPGSMDKKIILDNGIRTQLTALVQGSEGL